MQQDDLDTNFMNKKTFSADEFKKLCSLKRKTYSTLLSPEDNDTLTFYAPNDEAAKRYLDRFYTSYGGVVEVITTYRDVD